jgi:inhibitor of KinA sporulation pathway (predicted exonuclease)
MDLEWNNVYIPKTKSFMNEIIEVGAVMLNDELEKIGEFSRLIKSRIGKKIRSNIKKLTHITNDDVRNGEPFETVMQELENWIGDRENVILTWGNSDIRVIIENFRFLTGCDTVPFMKNYTDAQRYFQIKKGIPVEKQLGLFNAAVEVGMNPDEFSHHRALDDSLLTAECFKRVYSEDFAKYIQRCDGRFYEKLFFKPYAISNIHSPLVDKSLLSYTCEECGVKGEMQKNWRYSNQYFRTIYVCPQCGKKVRVAVRFKKYYDRLDTRKTVTQIFDDEQSEPIQNGLE